MGEFKDSARIFLKDARKDLTNRRYACYVIHTHLVIEHTLKALLSKKHVGVKFKAIPDLAQEALKLDLINQNTSKHILSINSLRNKVYPKGYIPRAHEAENALQIAEKCFQIVSQVKTNKIT